MFFEFQERDFKLNKTKETFEMSPEKNKKTGYTYLMYEMVSLMSLYEYCLGSRCSISTTSVTVFRSAGLLSIFLLHWRYQIHLTIYSRLAGVVLKLK